MPEQPDRELLDRFRAEQDVASLECLIRRHADFVFGICSRVLRNRHDAEDAFQATFLILVSRPPRLRRSSSLAGWLFRVAHRTAFRLARQRRRLVELDDLMAPSPEPFEDIYQQEAVLALDEELSALPERYRAPLVLCSLLGKSRREAAGELGRSEASVKASLTRGKHLLRTRLLRRGILLSIAAAAGRQLFPSPACASEQLVQLTSGLCQSGASAPGAGSQPSPEIQSLANSGVLEMTTAFSAKLAATAVAVTVVAGGVLVASLDAPRPAAAAGPLETTLDEASDESAIAFQPQASGNNPLAVTQTTPQPGLNVQFPEPLPPGPGRFSDDFSSYHITGAAPDVMVQTVPSQQLMHERAVEYERTRDETLINIEYQRAMAEVMQMKAEAKQIEAQAMSASVQDRDSILARSREVFATAESREFEAEAARLTAEADLLERRLTALGAPFQTTDPTQHDSAAGMIEIGDVLTIRLVPDPDGIWGVRELTVSPEGNITLPYVGEQPVAGLEFGEFVEKLEKYYTAGNVFEAPVFEVLHTRPAERLAPADSAGQPATLTYPEPVSEPQGQPAARELDPPGSDAAVPGRSAAQPQPLPLDDSDSAQ